MKKSTDYLGILKVVKMIKFNNIFKKRTCWEDFKTVWLKKFGSIVQKLN